MVPCEKILERAQSEKADMIVLAADHASLDEMVTCGPRKWERHGLQLRCSVVSTTNRASRPLSVRRITAMPVFPFWIASRAVPVTSIF